MAVDIYRTETSSTCPDPNINKHILYLLPPTRITAETATIATTSSYSVVQKVSHIHPRGVSPITLATQPMQLTIEEVEELEAFMASGKGFPKVELQEIPEGDRALLKHKRKK
jgi:hypothetical protein